MFEKRHARRRPEKDPMAWVFDVGPLSPARSASPAGEERFARGQEQLTEVERLLEEPPPPRPAPEP